MSSRVSVKHIPIIDLLYSSNVAIPRDRLEELMLCCGESWLLLHNALPIATLFSSKCDKRSKAHAAFSFAIDVPVFRALANGLIAPDEAISPLFSSQSDRLKIAVTPTQDPLPAGDDENTSAQQLTELEIEGKTEHRLETGRNDFEKAGLGIHVFRSTTDLVSWKIQQKR
uniref:Uncharacterized protein n=1 Tax=Salix viminalis TaxID=40686 RepID=A0A6N2L637_SALVM